MSGDPSNFPANPPFTYHAPRIEHYDPMAIEIEETYCEFVALSDRMLASEAWKQGVSETLKQALNIVQCRRKFWQEVSAEIRDSYKGAGDGQ